MNQEQEGFLKKILIEGCISKELATCVLWGKDAKVQMLEENTVFLRFLYNHLVAPLPLFAEPGVLQRLDMFLATVPRLNALARKASRREQQATNVVACALMEIFIRSKLEQEADLNRYRETATSSANNPTFSCQGLIHHSVFSVSRTELLNAFIAISQHLAEAGPDSLFYTFQNTINLHDLPLVYRRGFSGFINLLRQTILMELSSPHKIEKFARVFKLFPKTALVSLSALTNPVTYDESCSCSITCSAFWY